MTQLKFANGIVTQASADDLALASGAMSCGTVDFTTNPATENWNAPPVLVSPEEGYAVALDVQWEFRKKEQQSVIIRDEPEYGFFRAVKLPYQEGTLPHEKIWRYKVFQVDEKLYATPKGIMSLGEFYEGLYKEFPWTIELADNLEEVGKSYSETQDAFPEIDDDDDEVKCLKLYRYHYGYKEPDGWEKCVPILGRLLKSYRIVRFFKPYYSIAEETYQR